MIQGEGWLKVQAAALHCIPMRRWSRTQWYDDTGLPWLAPSPNIPDLETALLYSGLCLIEGTPLSEGRGTERPFATIGAPWLDADAVANTLDAAGLHGVSIWRTDFTPVANRGAMQPKFEGRKCAGVSISVMNRRTISPILVGLALIGAAHAAAPDSMRMLPYFSLLAGTDPGFIGTGAYQPLRKEYERWQSGTAEFLTKRNKYLLYN
jgi:uncharacterized protein YbbC (DUF1343 family)